MNQEMISWSGSIHDIKPTSEIFVVDDDQDMQEILAASLEQEGVPVTSFENGDAFLEAASTRIPICVFLDVVMPKRSGPEILKIIQAWHYWTPIFLMSTRLDNPMIS